MSDDVTTLLVSWSRGDRAALERLMPLVYADLRRIAARHLRSERADHTLSATAVVHEAFLKLIGQRAPNWQQRAQFFALASQLMRRILVDHARRRAAGKRGGSALRLELDAEALPSTPRALELLAIDAALAELAVLDPRMARVVELRFFGGLSLEDTALALDVSRATVAREWALARGFLRRRIDRATGEAAPDPPAPTRRS